MSTTEVLVKELVEKNGKTRNSLMPVLQGIVHNEHFLSEEALLCVARELDLSAADVYGTASFYTFLDTVPRGKNIVRVCKTITCHMKGKDEIIKALGNALKIKVGETTNDKKFTLLTANCLGWCHKGPVMLVNDDIYPDLTTQKALEIIEEYAKDVK
ncbi:MAG: Fe-only hydrogenase fused subunits beta and gamma [Bacteroidetes bacterium]|jgi:NADH-quinone oxidoreductase subunit E|nr:MAG: Fe-only hydrogenase fused subunits beta and gamma [Bacteroidota bacterium]MBK6346334.1 NAD(P)H-dependent oxidoreductase subunit E [Bacteroidales bacterium]MBK9357508.1 NAD(P)H-dependent oxidoreductase subunit E [Bacteroidales bacterium]